QDGQYRLSEDLHRIARMDGDLSGFVEVAAQEDTSDSVKIMHFTSRSNPAASAQDGCPSVPRPGDAARLRDRLIGTECDRANVVAELCHEQFKMHGNQHLVLNN